MNHIRVFVNGNEKIAEIFAEHGEEIRSEVLADEILPGQTGGYAKEWNINGEKVMLGVEKIG